MKCKEMDKVAKLYANGEADFFQRKAFEKHMETCPECRKKYKETALIAALLFSSQKTVKRDYFAETILSYAGKIVIGAILIGTVTLFLTSVNGVQDKNIKENNKEIPISVELKENINVNNDGKINAKFLKMENEPSESITIRAIEGDRSIDINIDEKNMKIKNVQENRNK